MADDMIRDILYTVQRIERNQLQMARIMALHFRALYGHKPEMCTSQLTVEERQELLKFIENNVEYGTPSLV